MIHNPENRHQFKAAQGAVTTGPAEGRFSAKEESWPSRIWFWSFSQGWSKEQRVSPLQDLFVGQWWSGSYRKEQTFMHLFSQPGKLVGAHFCNMSYRPFHLYPLDLYITGEKTWIVKVTKRSFSLSLSCSFLKESVNSKYNTYSSKGEQGNPRIRLDQPNLVMLHQLVEPEHSHSHRGSLSSCPACYINLWRKYWRQSPGLTSVPHLWPCGNPAS